jgi:hypothetical protein
MQTETQVDLLPLMSLCLDSGTLEFECSTKNELIERITFSAFVAPAESIKDHRGFSLASSKWSMTVYASEAHGSEGKRLGALGFLRCVPEVVSTDQACIASISLGHARFNRLTDYVRSQGMPERVLLSVDGLQFNTNINGLVWNTGEVKYAPIYRARFDMPIIKNRPVARR